MTSASPVSPSRGRRSHRRALGVLAATVAASALPAAAHMGSASAASSCRPSIAVSAPSSAPIQQAVTVTARVKPCNDSNFYGSCVLEDQVGNGFVALNSAAVLGDNACDFPTSFNTAGQHNLRVRFTGDQTHQPAVSRTVKITFKAPSSTTNDLKVGLAFVDSSVTARGGRAALPSGTTVYRPGSTIGGVTGCPTSSFGQDGLMVLVLDYAGGPTSASITTTITPPEGGQGFTVAPYYLDLDPGQRVQFLGPRNQNGTYDILVEYGYARATGFPKLNARFTLNRTCQQ